MMRMEAMIRFRRREKALEKATEKAATMISSISVMRKRVCCKDLISVPWVVSYSVMYTQPTTVP